MRLRRDRPGVTCTAILVPAGRSLFVQVELDVPESVLVLRPGSGSDLRFPLDRQPADPVGTRSAQPADLAALQAAPQWQVLVADGDDRDRPVTWDGRNPVADVSLLHPPDPVTGWAVNPAADRRGRLILQVSPPGPVAVVDTVVVGERTVELAGHAVAAGGRPTALIAAADDGRSVDLPVSGSLSAWTATVPADALPVGGLPMRWSLRLDVGGGTRLPVGRPFNDLTALPQVCRYPWCGGPGAVSVRPQFTYSRKLELHQRAPQEDR